MPKSNHRPRLVFQPKTYRGMQRGINLLADAVRPTLGPLPRNVAIDRVVKTESQSFAELLDDGGLIARRLLQLKDADADMGAMFMRQVLWQQHLRVGDGTAFTAVLFQSVYNGGMKYITAGGNAMRLRGFIEAAMRVVIEQLERMACPLEGEQRIAQLTESVCHDAALAKTLGDVFDVIGAWGQLEVRAGHGREVYCEYFDGPFYKSGVLSEQFVTGRPGARVDLTEAAVLLTDLELQEPDQFVPALKMIFESGCKGVLITARSVSDKVMSILTSINKQLAPFTVVAVKSPDALHGLSEFIQDLEVLTGARAYLRAAGQSLDSFRMDDLGGARRIWADKTYTGFNGVQGAALEIVAHVEKLKTAYANAEKAEDRQNLLARINLFMGGAAVVWVGGVTQHDINARKALTERSAQVIRKTLMSGMLPGGGIALLACCPALDALADETDDLDERTAYRIVSAALKVPLTTILSNGGRVPGPILHDIVGAGQGCGFDLRTGQVVNMIEAGIIDSAEVMTAAVHSACASAALALTVDVLVHHRKPETAFEP